AIAQHTFKYKHLSQLSSLADILILVDEIEEFSRYGRKMWSRDYHDTTAKAEISFESGNPKNGQTPKDIKPGDDINISIKYSLAGHLDSNEDFYRYFEFKAKELCQIYSLGTYDEHNYRVNPKNEWQKKFTYIKSIKMEVVNNQGKKAYVHIHDEKDTDKIFLPEIEIKIRDKTKDEIKDKILKEGEYKVTCIDDELEITIDSDVFENITLKELVENVKVKK
ncbi:hypothetical protein KAR91_49600, partial [Candidatus Pacearchaeota archaeon]|nr:hypothetical protein [Candidatus Pacearchaeota archaeon]